MTAQIGWLLSLLTVTCLLLQSGVLHQIDDSPEENIPRTIDEVMMRASGGKKSVKLLGRSSHSRFVEDGLDMMLTRRQHQRLYSGERARTEGRTVATPWTDGVIPYQITPDDFDDDQIQWIHRAMQHWEEVTCVQFRPATSQDRNNVTIRTGQGCWAHLGMIGGNQIINLDPYCFWKGIIEHELGHTIGLIHEHQRPQRDAFIRVNYYGVQSNFVDALKKYAKNSDDKMGLEYDYTSVMHYGKTAFSSDGYTQTLFPRDPTKEDVVGMITGPSFLDAKLVNLMYRCSDECNRSPKPRCSDDCFLNKNCQCFCPEDMTKEVCMDHDSKCSQWRDEGECRGNSFYMYTFCRKSCGICTDDGSTPRLPCINGHSNCEEWARTEQCEKNPGFMYRRCRLACGQCEVDDDLTPKGPCMDKNSSCPALADKGGCVRDPAHMLKDCTRSCDFCPEDVGIDPSDRPGTCTDYDGICHYWADSNLCNRYYAWMSLNCRNACGTCNANIQLPPDCVDETSSCFDWALKGECHNNPGFMMLKCNQSCDNCKGLNKPEVGCVDFQLDCPKWAEAYECWANPKFMLPNCPKSCKVCKDDPPTQPPPCMDFNRNCDFWLKEGECEKNPIWMANYCRKSCGKCTGNEPAVHTTPDTGSESCVDDHESCPSWAATGQCEMNPSYMNNHCKKSCRICSGGDYPDTNQGPCRDDKEDCKGWAAYGECAKNPSYMRNHCKKSCGVCT